jgi:hypothetical protein
LLVGYLLKRIERNIGGERKIERERGGSVYLKMLPITGNIQSWLWNNKLCVFWIVSEVIITWKEVNSVSALKLEIFVLNKELGYRISEYKSDLEDKLQTYSKIN